MRILLPTIYSLLLMGCAHASAPQEPHEGKTSSVQSPVISSQNLTPWHDGSNGGNFGIGEGWSIELLPADYETIVQELTPGTPIAMPLNVFAYEYEWVKDDGETGDGYPYETKEIITIPAEYMIVTETVLVEPKETEYYLTVATYNPEGSIAETRMVKPRQVRAVTKKVELQVVKTPKRFEERQVYVERRKGYRLDVRQGRQLNEVIDYDIKIIELKRVEAQPWRFLIKHPKGYIAHVFDDFDDLTAFVDGLQ